MKQECTFSKIKSILWATDFSKESRFCLPYIRLFSTVLNTENHALYVLPKVSDWVVETAITTDERLLNKIQKTKKNTLKKIMDYSKKSAVPFTPGVSEGTPSEEISKYASEKGIDIIFTGRRGISGIEEMVVGSTTSRLIRDSRVPVMIIPKNKRAVKIKRILCPLDYNEFLTHQLQCAISLARQFKAALDVVHIFDFSRFPIPIATLDENKLMDMISKKINKIAEMSQFKIDNIIFDMGEPADKVIKIAKKNKVDMITMATHQRKGIVKFFLGSISEKIIQYATIPVLILPPPGT